MVAAASQQRRGFLAGYSGHALVVADAAVLTGCQLNGYFATEAATENPLGLEYLGHENDTLLQYSPSDGHVILGIGNNHARRTVAQFFRSAGFETATIAHPASTVSTYASIGAGSFVGANASVNAMVEIGQDCIINTGAIVEHGCRIGCGSHVAPGAILCGDVTVGSLCFIGAGSVIKQGVSIGDRAVVGAGAVVLNDLPADEQWVGVPARQR